MCVKEYFGFICGHCSIPTLHKCPVASQVSTYPACSLPAERPVLTNDYCPACARVVWNSEVLQREEEHRMMHERNECVCRTNFNLQREYHLHSEYETEAQFEGGKSKVKGVRPVVVNGMPNQKIKMTRGIKVTRENESKNDEEDMTRNSIHGRVEFLETSTGDQRGTDIARFRLTQDQPVGPRQDLVEASLDCQNQTPRTVVDPEPCFMGMAQTGSYEDRFLSSTTWQLPALPKLGKSTFQPAASKAITAQQEFATNVAGGMRFYPQTQEQRHFPDFHNQERHTAYGEFQPHRLGLQVANSELSRAAWRAVGEDMLGRNRSSRQTKAGYSQALVNQTDNTRAYIGRIGERRGTALTSSNFQHKRGSHASSVRPDHKHVYLTGKLGSKYEERIGEVDRGSSQDREIEVLGVKHARHRSTEDLSHALFSETKTHDRYSKERDNQNRTRNCPDMQQRPGSA